MATPQTYSVTFDDDGYASKITVRRTHHSQLSLFYTDNSENTAQQVAAAAAAAASRECQ